MPSLLCVAAHLLQPSAYPFAVRELCQQVAQCGLCGIGLAEGIEGIGRKPTVAETPPLLFRRDRDLAQRRKGGRRVVPVHQQRLCCQDLYRFISGEASGGNLHQDSCVGGSIRFLIELRLVIETSEEEPSDISGVTAPNPHAAGVRVDQFTSALSRLHDTEYTHEP